MRKSLERGLTLVPGNDKLRGLGIKDNKYFALMREFEVQDFISDHPKPGFQVTRLKEGHMAFSRKVGILCRVKFFRRTFYCCSVNARS